MCILLYITLLLYVHKAKGDENLTHNLTIDELSNKIVDVFGVKHEHGRIKELQEKKDKINSYVVSNDLFAELLTNVTNETTLNETNFYQSLNENDHFRFLTTNDSENLYLKLKAKMNRDDIFKILASRGEKGKLMKSARRMMKNTVSKRGDDNSIHDVIDKFIGEVPKDNHRVKAKESIYWDPQGALEDLKEYYDAKRDGRRIYKGERTSIRDWPFMVSIHVMGRFWCGGSLYWSDLVITSASCLQLLHNNRFFRENPKVVQVRVGSNHSRVGGEMLDVMEVYFHPGYNPRTLENNLAVTRLRRHLAFNYHRIPKVIAISDIPDSIPTTAELLVLGWGVTKMSQKLSYEPIFLQKKYIPVYPNTFCKEVYGHKFITDKMFCAGTFTTGEGACDHDAGGPAVIAGRLVGIISFGPSVCGFTNAPTVFTLVGAFNDWIENVNESMPDYYRGKISTTSSTKSGIVEMFNTWHAAKIRFQNKQKATKVIPLGEPYPTLGPELIEASEITPPVINLELALPTTTEAEEIYVTPETPEGTPEGTPEETPGGTPEGIPEEPPEDKTTSPSPAALRTDDSDGGWSIENRH